MILDSYVKLILYLHIDKRGKIHVSSTSCGDETKNMIFFLINDVGSVIKTYCHHRHYINRKTTKKLSVAIFVIKTITDDDECFQVHSSIWYTVKSISKIALDVQFWKLKYDANLLLWVELSITVLCDSCMQIIKSKERIYAHSSNLPQPEQTLSDCTLRGAMCKCNRMATRT